MAITLLSETYYEVIDSESPSTITVNNNESYAVITFLIKQDEIFTFLEDVLGYSQLVNNTFVTRPKIPASHPLFPWLYAIGIQDIKGYSNNGRENSGTLQSQTAYSAIRTEKPNFTGSYKQYKITVRYQSREYSIYDNEQLAPFRQNNTPNYMPEYRFDPINNEYYWSERNDDFTNRAEYCRFTNWTYSPKIEYLTYGGNNYYMKRAATPIGEPREWPISTEQNSTNYLFVVRSAIDINWFSVPFEWSVNNAILTESYSKINYEDFMFFPKGSLLFTNMEVRKYDPQFPFLHIDLTVNSSVYDYYTEFYKNQYCDVTFKMSYMIYPDGTKSATNPQLYTPLQVRDVNSFHNRVIGPNSRLWYYVDSGYGLYQNIGGVPQWVPTRNASPIYWNINFKNLFNYREGA